MKRFDMLVSNVPKVSVIIPVFNTEDWLPDCLNSVLNQTLFDIEIICVNDASTDNSLAVLRKYADIDSRVIIIEFKSNRGVSAARNYGASYASGEFIYFMDSDDMINNIALERLYSFATSLDLDVCCFDAHVICDDTNQDDIVKIYKGESGYFKRKCSYKGVKRGLDFLCEAISNGDYKSVVYATFINSEFYFKEGLSFFDGIVHEDELFTFQLLVKARKVAYLNEALYIRRIRSDSIMTSKKLFKHTYGCFVCVIKMIQLYENIDFDNDNKKCLVLHNINRLLSASRKIYNKLEINEQIKFNDLGSFERFAFERLIVDYCELQLNNSIVLDELNKIKNIQSGYSFRIGRMITFIPRKIRDAIKYYRKNSLSYTVKICKEKLLCLFRK